MSPNDPTRHQNKILTNQNRIQFMMEKTNQTTASGFLTAFPADVQKAMDLGEGHKYYVYILYDPRVMQPFYVGKGMGDRCFQHARNVKGLLKSLQAQAATVSKENEEDAVSLKEKQIMDIINSGHEVVVMILRWGLDEETAYEVEAAAIDLCPLLTNEQSGHAPERGMISPDDLSRALSTPVYDEPSFDYVLIKIKQAWLDRRGSIYETVRRAWRLNLDKVKDYKYVLAVKDGVVVSVFEVFRWYTDPDEQPRVVFDGHESQNPEAQKLIGKKIPDYYRQKGQQNPAVYKK